MDNKTQERIKADAGILPADILSEINDQAGMAAESFSSTEDAWKAGAIYSELKYHNSNRAQVLVDALIAIGNGCATPQYRANAALELWKGEEVEPVKEIEYMPIHPDDARKFDCPTHFPMHLLDEGQAQRNHSQTLKRLKERGGLSVREILAIVGKKPWSYYSKLPWDEAIKMLNDIVITNPQK